MTKDELIDAVATLSEQIRELKELIASPAWQKYSALMDEQQKGRIDTLILSPLPSMDSVLAAEYAKGEIAGIRLCLELVPNMVEQFEAQLEPLEERLGAENE